MADQEYAIVQTLTASGQNTDGLIVHDNPMRRAFVGVHVKGAASKTLAVQIKPNGEPDTDYQAISADPPSDTDPYKVYTIVGEFTLRLAWVSGGTGSLEVILTR